MSPLCGNHKCDFLGLLLPMIHRWLPYLISQNEPRLTEVPFLTGSCQCRITPLGWLELVKEVLFLKACGSQPSHSHLFSRQPSRSILSAVLASDELRETFRWHRSDSTTAAGWQGHNHREGWAPRSLSTFLLASRCVICGLCWFILPFLSSSVCVSWRKGTFLR